MAHKSIGGWLIKDKFFAQMKIANELWSFSRRDGSDEKQTQLLFIGWYGKDTGVKLFSINFLWLSFQFGFS